MDADNLKEIGHRGFTIDAETMTAFLFDFATDAGYRAAVKKEFDGRRRSQVTSAGRLRLSQF